MPCLGSRTLPHRRNRPPTRRGAAVSSPEKRRFELRRFVTGETPMYRDRVGVRRTIHHSLYPDGHSLAGSRAGGRWRTGGDRRGCRRRTSCSPPFWPSRSAWSGRPSGPPIQRTRPARPSSASSSPPCSQGLREAETSSGPGGAARSAPTAPTRPTPSNPPCRRRRPSRNEPGGPQLTRRRRPAPTTPWARRPRPVSSATATARAANGSRPSTPGRPTSPTARPPSSPRSSAMPPRSRPRWRRRPPRPEASATSAG